LLLPFRSPGRPAAGCLFCWKTLHRECSLV